MLFRFLIVIFTSFVTCVVNADGVSLNQSRIVFSQKDKSQVLQIHNGTSSPVLAQLTVLEEVDGKAVDNFILTPPLFRVDAKSEFASRVLPNNIASLPEDRESIFYLKARVIPAINKTEEKDKPSLVFVTAFVIKLIYRPDVISAPGLMDYKKVNLVRKNGKWEFQNVTPYYMTVVGLSIDGSVEQNSLLLKPFSSYEINKNIKDPSSVSWYFLNDFGSTTEKQLIKKETEIAKDSIVKDK
ncbi:molecular chaperone [Providencia vermicola]|uniref:Molecular chaperone n=1 Tax=Providencia vermicola TaxID=333965 RepID=A0AAX3RYH7_9GAMM|nr:MULTISPECIES: molecular chaperone [Providencia]ELR5122950.1 molecular chaperone [Providencia stuartii]ELX8379864.1 molecular chaperone [Providencia stuartii]EMD5259254.1 molecular chaperone [Providencia stuartii]MBG5920653.1 molecular chaperone [Providencia stuartii]USB38267.1 molecular chaperone [Providencia vermicola]